MNGLIVTTILTAITINLSLLKEVVVSGDTKEVRYIKDKDEEMDSDITMEGVDV